MTPVKNELVSAISNVKATMDCEGPFSSEPVRRRIHMNPMRTGKARKSENPTQVSSTQSAVIPLPALTRATQRASKIQPTTSFPTPADRTMTPTGVESSFSSVRMRQRTGKACVESGACKPNVRF